MVAALSPFLEADRPGAGLALVALPAPARPARLFGIADAVAALTLAGAAAGLVVLVHRGIPDDAYIYLRFVDNLLSGHGWAFNPGHPVDAATSPAYTLLLLVLGVVGIGGPDALLVAFGLGLCALGLGLYAGLRDIGRLSAWTLALAALSWPALLRVVGLETSVFAAALVLAALAYERRWLWTAGVAAGLVALARPEGLILAVLLGLLEIVRPQGRSARIILPTLALVVPWKLFEWLVLGSPVPHSLQVKALQGSLNPQPWIAAFSDQIPLPVLVVPLAVLGCALAVGRWRRGRPFALIVISVGVLQCLAYTALNAPSWYRWYFEPGNLALLLAALLGLEWTGRRALECLGARGPGWCRLALRRPVPLAGLMVLVLAGALFWECLAVPGESSSLTAPFELSSTYLSVAQWLRAHAPAGTWVATGKIGYLGYYSGLDVLDTMGLADEGSVPLLAKEPWYWWFASRPAPLYVVVHVPAWPGEPEAPGAPAAWPATQYARFEAQYRPVFRVAVPETEPGQTTRALVVYERRSTTTATSP